MQRRLCPPLGGRMQLPAAALSIPMDPPEAAEQDLGGAQQVHGHLMTLLLHGSGAYLKWRDAEKYDCICVARAADAFWTFGDNTVTIPNMRLSCFLSIEPQERARLYEHCLQIALAEWLVQPTPNGQKAHGADGCRTHYLSHAKGTRYRCATAPRSGTR